MRTYYNGYMHPASSSPSESIWHAPRVYARSTRLGTAVVIWCLVAGILLAGTQWDLPTTPISPSALSERYTTHIAAAVDERRLASDGCIAYVIPDLFGYEDGALKGQSIRVAPADGTAIWEARVVWNQMDLLAVEAHTNALGPGDTIWLLGPDK